MLDIDLKFIVVCIFRLPVKAALHHGGFIYKIKNYIYQFIRLSDVKFQLYILCMYYAELFSMLPNQQLTP